MNTELWNQFPEWVSKHQDSLEQLAELTRSWNEKINVVSRKDIDDLESRHIQPSLAISHIIRFRANTSILDVGSGGGYPGLPMAIIYPETNFTLIDSVAKKVRVINDIVENLGLKNVTTSHTRVEEIKERFDFVTGRAVTALPKFIPWVQNRIYTKNKNDLRNGILYWKGGEMESELNCKPDKIYPLDDLLKDDYFKEKYIAHFSFKTMKNQ